MAKHGTYVLSAADWPLVYVIAGGNLTDAEHEAYIAELTDLAQRREPHGVLVDATGAVLMSARQRAREAEYLNATEALLRDFVTGIAIVTNSRVVQGAMTAVNWFLPKPYPLKFTASFAEAAQWTCQQLTRRTPLPATLTPERVIQNLGQLRTSGQL